MRSPQDSLRAVVVWSLLVGNAAGQAGEVLLSYRQEDAPAAAGPALPPGADGEASSLRVDQAVWPAAHVVEPPGEPVAEPTASPVATEPAALHELLPSASADPAAEGRRLPPRTEASDASATRLLNFNPDRSATPAKRSPLPFSLPMGESLKTAAGGLVAVIGLFVACALLLRKGKPRQPGVLPGEAFALLGVAPLAGRSAAHLIRLGNKLVLLAIAPEGVQTLAEVTDPAEVDRIAGLCSSTKLHGPAAEFQQVLAQLSREPARGFLGREAGRR